MPMLRTLLFLFLVPLLVGFPSTSLLAQPPPAGNFPVPAENPEADPDLSIQMTYDEVYQLLLSRGLTEEAASELLRDHDPDSTFTTREVNEILRRVRQEDLSTR